jgi:uncharacterized protein (TIGR02453 family)
MAKPKNTAPTQPATTFAGFPVAALSFFDDLEENNTRDWWHANKARYDTQVRGPMELFLSSVAAEFGTAHLFRPNRDTRFSHDKSPYKTNIGATTYRQGAVFYVHLDGAGLMAASGYYMMATDQILRYRAAVADEKSGSALQKIVEQARSDGLRLGEPALKRVPTPYPKDHLRADLLRYKSVTFSKQFGTPPWMSSARAADEVVTVWRGCQSLNKWLAKHVGESTEPQDR